jgi:hypothetical protein
MHHKVGTQTTKKSSLEIHPFLHVATSRFLSPMFHTDLMNASSAFVRWTPGAQIVIVPRGCIFSFSIFDSVNALPALMHNVPVAQTAIDKIPISFDRASTSRFPSY